jgi:hypothetical protein
MQVYRRVPIAFGIVSLTIATASVIGAVARGAAAADAPGWDPKTAASYLDDRAAFWATCVDRGHSGQP